MTDPMDRKTFGQIIGAAAIGASLPDLAGAAESSAAAAPGDELCNMSATVLAARIRQKQVSAREVLTAHLARIERVNPKVNAIVTLVAERAIADAKKADEQQAHG